MSFLRYIFGTDQSPLDQFMQHRDIRAIRENFQTVITSLRQNSEFEVHFKEATSPQSLHDLLIQFKDIDPERPVYHQYYFRINPRNENDLSAVVTDSEIPFFYEIHYACETKPINGIETLKLEAMKKIATGWASIQSTLNYLNECLDDNKSQYQKKCDAEAYSNKQEAYRESLNSIVDAINSYMQAQDKNLNAALNPVENKQNTYTIKLSNGKTSQGTIEIDTASSPFKVNFDDQEEQPVELHNLHVLVYGYILKTQAAYWTPTEISTFCNHFGVPEQPITSYIPAPNLQ